MNPTDALIAKEVQTAAYYLIAMMCAFMLPLFVDLFFAAQKLINIHKLEKEKKHGKAERQRLN